MPVFHFARYLSRLALSTLALLPVVGSRAQTAAAPTTVARLLPKAQVLEDLTLFQHIKESAHAGIYKYRTKAQMDSVFAAARAQVTDHMTIIDVYKLVVAVTSFEGSTHNDTFLPDSVMQALNRLPAFFPYPLKLIQGRVRFNYAGAEIPVGAEIVAINQRPTPQLVAALGKYYTTDGYNLSGRQLGFNGSFPKLFFYEYGPQTTFQVAYRESTTAEVRHVSVPAVAWQTYAANRRRRHSLPIDSLFGQPARKRDYYHFRVTDSTAILTVRCFAIGDNAKDPVHKTYVRFLDSCFTVVNTNPAIVSVLVDVRGNPGGTDPNDLITFSYLAERPFRENTSAFVLFRRIPYWKYVALKRNFLVRFVAKKLCQRELAQEFTDFRDGKYYQNQQVNVVYQPNPNRSKKPLYLLIDPAVASAASLFSALVRGNTNAVVIGEETQGGYYGHTGHTPAAFILPHSGIQTALSVVDLVQDVPTKATQPPGRGIMPDYPVTQSYEDFMANRDTQLAFTLKLIAAKTMSAR